MRSRMSIIPKIFSHWWETLEQPHRLMDQHFGVGMRPEQFMTAFDRSPHFLSPLNYYRPWADIMRDTDAGWSMVKNDKDKFHVALDIQQFKPEEINVKVVDNYIVVEGKHEDKEDEHGVVSRHFIRKYLVPEQCDPEKTTSSLSTDGILTITAPRKPQAVEDKREKVIKIEHTGKPAVEDTPKKEQIKQ